MLRPIADQIDDFKARDAVLSSGLDPRKGGKKQLNFYVRVMARAIGAELCSIFIHDPDEHKAWLYSSIDQEERAIVVTEENSITGRVITSGEAVHETGLESRDGAHKKVDAETGFVTREVLCVPILSLDGETVTGAVQALNKREGQFDEEDRALLEEMAHMIQLNIEQVYHAQEMAGFMDRHFAAICNTMRAVVIGGVSLIVIFIAYLAMLALSGSLAG